MGSLTLVMTALSVILENSPGDDNNVGTEAVFNDGGKKCGSNLTKTEDLLVRHAWISVSKDIIFRSG
jgi:hypothetical protein